ncbi:MAG: extracellular solute-binding protein [Trueperaceae bacterium]|nr:extracellular solute-binding protein [Trueperaceae bacterium]
MQRMWTKTWTSVLALAFLAFGTAQTLDMWSWRTEDIAAYNQILDVYEAQNPGVSIDFEAFLNTEYNTLVATSLQADAAADVVQTRSYGGVTEWIDGGYLVPLDGRADNLANYSDTALDAVRSRDTGEVFGMPFAIQTLQMYYNRAIFAELGLEPPTTWDEFIAINDTLLGAGYIPLAITGKDSWMLPIFHTVVGAGTYGGNDFVDAVLAGDTTFEDPAFVESLQAVKDLQPYMPPGVTGVSYVDTQNLFVNELAAMFPGGSWEAAFFSAQNPDLDLGVFTVPAKNTNQQLVSWFVDGSWAVTTSAEDVEASLDFVNWLGSTEFGQLFTDTLAQISPIEGVVPTDPILNEIVELWNANATPYMLLVHFRYGAPSGTVVLGQDMQSLFLDNMTPEEVATSLQEQMATWFTPGSSPQASQ